MNRSAHGQRQRPTISEGQIRRAIGCLDCAADIDSAELELGVYAVAIYHDPTCAWLAEFERGGGLGVGAEDAR